MLLFTPSKIIFISNVRCYLRITFKICKTLLFKDGKGIISDWKTMIHLQYYIFITGFELRKILILLLIDAT